MCKLLKRTPKLSISARLALRPVLSTPRCTKRGCFRANFDCPGRLCSNPGDGPNAFRSPTGMLRVPAVKGRHPAKNDTHQGTKLQEFSADETPVTIITDFTPAIVQAVLSTRRCKYSTPSTAAAPDVMPSQAPNRLRLRAGRCILSHVRI